MKLVLAAIFLFGAAATGCSSPRVIQPDQLPVYGVDPLSSTRYLGSDERYHYFALQKDKAGRYVVIRKDDAQIDPEPFDVAAGRRRFVLSVDQGVVRLMQPQTKPAPSP